MPKSPYKTPAVLPQQLIAKLYQRYTAWATAADDESYSEKKWQLRNAIQDVFEGAVTPTAPAELLELAGRMLPHFCFNKVNTDERVDMRLSKTIALLLQDPVARQACLAQPDGDKAIAWACLQRAVECDVSNMRDKGELINNILTAWLGRELPCPEKPTQADVVGTIYGGHYWTANFLEYDWSDRKLPNKLWKANQPILLTATASMSSTGANIMPDDLSF